MLSISITDPHYTLKTAALNALQEVMDPELCINIVDLGLVYDITVEDKNIRISMTLSTPACPMGGIITANAKLAVEQMLVGYECNVALVWEPAWGPEMVSEEGKAELGW